MRYTRFGSTGLFVSELCLGTMTFGGAENSVWGQIGRLEERIAVLERIATDPAERTARDIDSLR